MENEQRILFKNILKKNGFKKTINKNSPNLMEFTKGKYEDDDYLLIYIYDDVEFYFEDFFGVIITSIEQFKELYEKYTLTILKY